MEQLNADQRKQAGSLIDYLGEETVRKLFSKTWQNREEGLNEVEDQIMNQNNMQEDQAFISGVGAVKITIADKMAGVGQKSMNLLSTITSNF